MQKIIFIRTAPYEYRLPERSLYSSFDEIGLQKANPHISKLSTVTNDTVDKLIKMHQPEIVFSSELTRSKETAELFSADIFALSELNEIKFSMEDFSSPKDLQGNIFDVEKVNKLRNDFSQALIKNELDESSEEILARMIRLGEILDSFKLPKTILCCSHGFIMKLFENYYAATKKNSLEHLVKMYDWKNPTYGFLEGFVVEGEKVCV